LTGLFQKTDWRVNDARERLTLRDSVSRGIQSCETKTISRGEYPDEVNPAWRIALQFLCPPGGMAQFPTKTVQIINRFHLAR
jgi:hypothetical protein